MSNSTMDIAQQFETFFYTPYGLVTLAVVSILLTSLVWSVGCCIYCCCRRRQRLQQGGVTEANRDLHYFGVSDPNGTMTSGYNTGPLAYSVNSLSTDNAIYHTSLDSILDEEA